MQEAYDVLPEFGHGLVPVVACDVIVQLLPEPLDGIVLG